MNGLPYSGYGTTWHPDSIREKEQFCHLPDQGCDHTPSGQTHSICPPGFYTESQETGEHPGSILSGARSEKLPAYRSPTHSHRKIVCIRWHRLPLNNRIYVPESAGCPSFSVFCDRKRKRYGLCFPVRNHLYASFSPFSAQPGMLHSGPERYRTDAFSFFLLSVFQAVFSCA